MKRLKLSFAAGILTTAFAVSTAIAGQMPGGITSPPPPPPAESSVAGNMPTGATSSSPSSETSLTGDLPLGVTSAVDPVVEFTLGLLQRMFALF
jgi:hypothetical protein